MPTVTLAIKNNIKMCFIHIALLVNISTIRIMDFANYMKYKHTTCDEYEEGE